MREVWLIRHGESLANIGGSTSTPREIPLTDVGLREADQLGEQLSVRPDLIVVSPYVRTQQTAEPTKLRFPDVPVAVLGVQEFTYLAVSKCRGTTQEERRPLVEGYWQRADPHYCDGDQAESFAEFLGRTERFVHELNEHDFSVAYIFTHEQFIKGLMWHAMRLGRAIDSTSMTEFDKFQRSFKIPNASITATKFDADKQFYFGSIDTIVV